MKRYLSHSAAAVFASVLLCAAPASYAGVINFAALGAANPGAVDHVIDGDIYVQISGNRGTGYLDGLSRTTGLPSGLGECQRLNLDGSCAPTTDDNVTEGEILTLSFFRNEMGSPGDALIVTLLHSEFRGELHNQVGDAGADIQAADTILFGLSGSALGEFTFGDSLSAVGNSIDFAYGGSDPNQFYLSTITIAEGDVPEPATLAMLLLGLGGLGLRKRLQSA